ncbi:MAG TPA: iron-sulfur cluster assembly accessory protein [Gemmatimonadota bacterium]|nr:iron-sulfur cluster assembly accessory protein [Gemmatimonadota bacterium]
MSQTQQESSIVGLSPEAAEKARQFIADEGLSAETAGLRVSVLPGGCSGFQYGLNLEDEPRGDDEIIASQGIKLFVDPFSIQYLKGTLIGYHSSFQGSGFTFTNPNATGGCGCGSSFAV